MEKSISKIEPGGELMLPPDSEGLTEEARTELEEAKEVFKKLLDKGILGVDVAYDLMSASDHPMVIDTFAKLLKSVADINKELVNLQKSKKELGQVKVDTPAGNQVPGVVNNQAIFVGSSEELRKIFAKGLTE